MEVVFLGDISRGGQAHNVQVMHDLFAPIFRRIGIPCRAHISDTNYLQDIHKWLPIWETALNSYDTSELDYLSQNECVVLGFEMPEPVLEKLNDLGIRWINAFIHPARFGNDLFFHFETSFESNLKESWGSEIGLYCAANFIMRKYKDTSGVSDSQNSLLILGQEPKDKSVYFDHEFKSLWSYREKISQIVGQYNKIYYKPHIAVSNPEVDKLVVNEFEAELVAEPNFYKFLAESNVKACCAISSSTIHQAQYFNVDGIFLEPRAKQFGAIIDYGRTLSDGAFWGSQFLQMPDMADVISEASVTMPQNHLRGMFASWGYFAPNQDIERYEAQVMQHISSSYREHSEHFQNLERRVGKIEKWSLRGAIKRLSAKLKSSK